VARIRWTQEAADWLETIYNYIAEDNVHAAGKVVSGIYEKAQVLAEYPQLGYIYRKHHGGTIRIILYGHYRIAYLHQDKEVMILGVFHGAMHIERYLPS
jgi:plasmid stabilization system protein ParE